MNTRANRKGIVPTRGMPSLARLQPSLLDRLTDKEPTNAAESGDKRALTAEQLRQCVLRDLGWLLNTGNAECAHDMKRHQNVARSAVNFGMRPLSGLRVSEVNWRAIEANMRRAILDFEPRILPNSLQIKAIDNSTLIDHHNMMAFEIRCQMWAQPYPLAMLLRTNLDLESGEMRLQDMSSTA